MGRPTDTFLSNFLAAPSGETQTTVQLNYKNGTVRRYATDILTISGNSFVDNLTNANDIKQTISGGTDRVELTILNTDKEIGLDIRAGNVHFAKVSLGRFFRLKDGTNQWREIFFGEAIPTSLKENACKIQILDDWVAAGYCVAAWTLSNICQIIFKSPECGYAGSETYCNHLLNGDCTKYARRFRNVSETAPIITNSGSPTAPSDSGVQIGGGETGWGGTGGTGNTCLLGDTPILMADWGYKRIDEIKEGEWVMAFDRKGILHPGRVTKIFKNEFESYQDLHFHFGSLGITGGHPILQSNFKFEQSRNFKKGTETLFLNKSNEWVLNPTFSNTLVKMSNRLHFIILKLNISAHTLLIIFRFTI